MKAEKLRSGNYRCRVCTGKDETGKYRYKSITDSDRKRCLRRAAELMDECRNAQDEEAGQSFADCVADYINSREKVLSAATIRGYRNVERQLKNHHAAFCNLPIVQINAIVLQKLVNDLVSRGLNPKSVRNYFALISAVFKHEGVAMPTKGVRLPEKTRTEIRVPDVEDVKTLLKAAADTELQIPIALAAFATMRRGEIVGATIDDVDFETCTIHVSRAVVEDADKNLIVKHPKTYDSDRVIPLPDFVIQKIKEKGRITSITRPHVITTRFERLAKRCGLEGVRFHALRHFAASWMHAQGIPDQYILARGGWSTDNVMKSVYRHELQSSTTEISHKITEKLTETFLGSVVS